MKQAYIEPAAAVLSLETIKETMVTESFTLGILPVLVTGNDVSVSDLSEDDYTLYF